MLKDRILKMLKLEGLIDNVSKYVETRVELLKIEVKEDLARLLAKVFLMMILTLFFILFVVLASMGLAWYLGALVKSMVGGYLMVSGMYLLLALISLIFRKEINRLLEKQLLALARQKSK